MLSEILDSLSIETKSASSLRPSQSLDCCHRGDLDACFSLPDRPGRTSWQPDKTVPEPQPVSLPADLSSLQSPDATSSSKDPSSQLSSEANQGFMSPPQFSTASADPESPSLPEPLNLPAIPPHQAAESPESPGGQDGPCPRLSAAPVQPSPSGSPQLPALTKPTSDTTWTPQLLVSSSDPTSPANPRTQLPKALLEHAHLQPPEEQAAPDSLVLPTCSWQESQPGRRPRVADLKKRFES